MAQPSVTESDRHLALSREYIGNAEDYLRQGNNKQASEKTWGAVAQQLKAVAERRGWNHDGHRLLIDIAQQVSDEWNRPDWFASFLAAKDLHANFYDDLMESDSIRIIVNNSNELLQELEQVLLSSPPNFAPATREQRRRWQRLTEDQQLNVYN